MSTRAQVMRVEPEDHYPRAEELLEYSGGLVEDSAMERAALATAQVHAALAQVDALRDVAGEIRNLRLALCGENPSEHGAAGEIVGDAA